MFYDSGCSHAMIKQEVCDNELESVILKRGPINIAAAGDTTVQVNHEYAVMMEMVDGSRQMMIGVSANSLTAYFPQVSLVEAHKEIMANVPKHKKKHISKIKVPTEAGGDTDVLLGIMFNSCYPVILHTLPSGLFIAKLKLKSHDGVTTGCIGGPHASFSALVKQCGDTSRLMSSFVSGLEAFRQYGAPKIAGPVMSVEDYDLANFATEAEMVDITGDQPSVADDAVVEDIEMHSGFTIQCVTCGRDVAENVAELLDGVKADVGEKKMQAMAAAYNNDPTEKLGDLKMLIKIQEQGVDIQYRCPTCRDCAKCKNAPDTERISLREELESEVIRDSINIDYVNKRITAIMPMRGDPAQFLSDNRDTAEKILEVQCKKMAKDPEARDLVIKAFDKLFKNQYIVKFSDLSPEQQEKIVSKNPQHYIAWRSVFKDSISTPCRPVFDASTKTPLNGDKGGRCLNDITMKGRVSTLNLINLLLNWSVGTSALCGDIRQFYNRIGLHESQWHLQRILYKEGLDIDAETVELIIVTLIYGVRCVSALSEAAVTELAKSVHNANSRLEKLLTVARFCDDIADSLVDKDAVKELIVEADKLFDSVGLEVKGWSVSGEDPPPDVSHDGASVDVGGLTWYPKIDSLVVKVPPLHFGQKLRGRIRVGTEVFDGKFSDLEKFVPKKLTRRMLTSKLSSFWDPLGKFTPLISGMKKDLRHVVKTTVSWDQQVGMEIRQKWIKNLWKLHNIRGIQFSRAVIPVDAADCKLELIAAVDAADLKVAAVYGRFRRKNGQYSCQLIIGRSLLARTDSTIPKEELESLTIGSNLLFIVRQALQDWVEDYAILSDSIISISWVTNVKKRMSIFHRNRANQFLMHTSTAKLFFVRSEYNIADVATRPDRVQDHDVGPNSTWERGLPWMKESLEKAIDEDIIKPANELRLDNTEDIEEVNKGFIIEKDLEVLVKGHHVWGSYVDRVQEMGYRASHSNYLFIPKFNFFKVVKITAIIFKFISSFAVIKRKRLRNIEDKAKLLPEDATAKFADVTVHTVEKVDEEIATKVTLTLTEAEIQRALVYWFEKATGEVRHFYKKEQIARLGVEKCGILFCRSRILTGQRFLQTGEFGEEDLGLDIGLNLWTPLVDRYSVIALSIALWIHQDISVHAGVESCYRASLQFCHIIQGPSLFKELSEECSKCRMIRKKYLEAACGPVHDHQLAVCPSFHTAFLDLDGPYEVYVPGFEKNTRNRKTLATKNYLMVFCCPVSKLLNIQVIETKDAFGIIEGLTRLACEVGMPKYLCLDKEPSFMKVVREAQIDLQDLQLRVFKECGVRFQTAPVSAHNFHGLVERKIRTVQEAFKKIDLDNMRIHSTGLQTLAKLVENAQNNLPLGFSFGRDATNTDLLKILTPNMLRLGRLNSRSLAGPIKLPKGPKGMMDRVAKLYDAFFRIWNVCMVPRLIPSPKWFKNSKEIEVDDVVWFQKVDNDISSKWTVGQIESIIRSKDGVVRRVNIRYNNASEVDDNGRGLPRETERSVRDIVRLFNVEDNYFVHDLQQVEDLIKQLEKDAEVDKFSEIRLEIDNNGVDKLRDKALMPLDSCQCCCSAHCKLMAWDESHKIGRVSGVTLARLLPDAETSEVDFPYTKEQRRPFDDSIRPGLALESSDDFFAMFTALETDFSLSPSAEK